MSVESREWNCLLVYFNANWTRLNLEPGVRQSFASVRSVALPGPQDPLTPEILELANRDIREAACALSENGRPGLMFSYSFDGFITQATFSELKRLGFVSVNYCVDAYHLWFRHCLEGGNYDAVCVAQSFHRGDFARYFPKVISLPLASPRRHEAVDFHKPRQVRCAMLGSRMPYREWLVRSLGQHDVPLGVYGKGWSLSSRESQPPPAALVRSDWGRYVPVLLRPSKLIETVGRVGEHVGVVFRQRKMLRSAPQVESESVCLEGFVQGPIDNVFRENSVNVGTSHLAGGWSPSGRCTRVQGRLRDFEVTAAGGFYLVQRHPDLAGLYDEGHEVEAWSDIDELVEKARYYLAHEDEALAIAERGHKRWKADHTWERRFCALLDALAEN